LEPSDRLRVDVAIETPCIVLGWVFPLRLLRIASSQVAVVDSTLGAAWRPRWRLFRLISHRMPIEEARGLYRLSAKRPEYLLAPSFVCPET
jgi:hypothetical protein